MSKTAASKPCGLNWNNMPQIEELEHNLRLANVRHENPEHTFDELKYRFGMPESEEKVETLWNRLRTDPVLLQRVRNVKKGAIKLAFLIPKAFRSFTGQKVESVPAIHISDAGMELISVSALDDSTFIVIH